MIPPRIFIALTKDQYRKLFDSEQQQQIAALSKSLTWLPDDFANDASQWTEIKSAHVLITGWGTPVLPQYIRKQTESLILALHAGATPRVFNEWLENKPLNIKISLASKALAQSVAEFTFSLMTLASKRAFWMERRVRQGGWRYPHEFFEGCFELFKCRIGLVGGGEIARQLIRMLSPLQCKIQVYDPYVAPNLLSELGVKGVNNLEELFANNQIVSIHAPHNEETHEMIRAKHLQQLPNGSLFINTARGPILHEPQLISELQKQRFVACLDVANREPPAQDHPFRTLANVFLTPHVAGAIEQNKFRLGQTVVEELQRFVNGEALQHEFLETSSQSPAITSTVSYV